MKNLKKGFLILLLSFFLISLVSSCGEIQQKDVPIRLTFPSNESSMNITVEYANRSGYWVDNQPMTQSGKSFYYDFLNTSDLGTYKYFACDNTGSCDYQCSFKVNYSGKEITIGEAVLYLVFILFFTLLFIALLILIGKLPSKNGKDSDGMVIKIYKVRYWRMALIGLTYPFGILIFNLILSLGMHFDSLGNFYGTISGIFPILLYLILPWVICIVGWVVIAMIKDLNLKNSFDFKMRSRRKWQR